eukprot:3922242-Pleurochrysis_carterae.AAC.1
MALTETGNLGITQGQSGRPISYIFYVFQNKEKKREDGFSMCNAWVCRGELIAALKKTAIVQTRKPHRGSSQTASQALGPTASRSQLDV